MYDVPPSESNSAWALGQLKYVSLMAPGGVDESCRQLFGPKSHRVPNPITCPISWSMTGLRVLLPTMPATSAVSNSISPSTDSPLELRTRHGPACPRIFPGPSIESNFARITSPVVFRFTAGVVVSPQAVFGARFWVTRLRLR